MAKALEIQRSIALAIFSIPFIAERKNRLIL